MHFRGVVVSCSGPAGGAVPGFPRSGEAGVPLAGAGAPLGQRVMVACASEGGQPDWATAGVTTRSEERESGQQGGGRKTHGRILTGHVTRGELMKRLAETRLAGKAVS